MYTSLVIEDKFDMVLFYIVDDAESQREKGPPYLLMLLLFKMIWNAEDQGNEFDKTKQNPIWFNLIRL